MADLSQGASEQEAKRKRIMFWFLCSAMTGYCSREYYQNTPEQIVDLSFEVAETATARWLHTYGANDGSEDE